MYKHISIKKNKNLILLISIILLITATLATLNGFTSINQDKTDIKDDSQPINSYALYANLTILLNASSFPTYESSDTVEIYAYFEYDDTNPVPGANVTYQINDPLGSLKHLDTGVTDVNGEDTNYYTLASNAMEGTWDVYVTARKDNDTFLDTQHLQFYVDDSLPTIVFSYPTNQTQS